MKKKPTPKKKAVKKPVKTPAPKTKRPTAKLRRGDKVTIASTYAVNPETRDSAPPAPKLSQYQLEGIKAMAAQGCSISTIAAAFGIAADELPALPEYRNGRISSVLTEELEEILGLREGQRHHPPISEELRGTQRGFLVAYAVCGTITEASAAAQIDRHNHYLWLKEDPGYPAAFAEAKEHFLDRAVDEAWRRALRGQVNPKFHQGELVGFEILHSDQLLQFMLKAGRAEYREKTTTELTGKDGAPLLPDAIEIRFVEPGECQPKPLPDEQS